MEYLERKPSRSLSVKEIRPILHQMATTLQLLSSLGAVHADLKTDNIMMVDCKNQPLRVKMIDFGLAHHVSQSWRNSYIQPRYYRSPEVILGLPYTAAIDMWSLGCIAAELFLGHLLYPGNCEYDMVSLQHMVQTQGQLPQHLLNKGPKTSWFFLRERRRGRWWRLKAAHYVWTDHSRSHMFSLQTPREYGKTYFPESYFNSLDDLKKTMSDDGRNTMAEIEDMENFVDLLKKMLHLDVSKRITPSQLLEDHPFITMSDVADSYPNSFYVKSCFGLMEVCLEVCQDQRLGSDIRDRQLWLNPQASTSTKTAKTTSTCNVTTRNTSTTKTTDQHVSCSIPPAWHNHQEHPLVLEITSAVSSCLSIHEDQRSLEQEELNVSGHEDKIQPELQLSVASEQSQSFTVKRARKRPRDSFEASWSGDMEAVQSVFWSPQKPSKCHASEEEDEDGHGFLQDKPRRDSRSMKRMETSPKGKVQTQKKQRGLTEPERWRDGTRTRRQIYGDGQQQETAGHVRGSRCTVRMQGKEASFCTGCWRLTLLSCVLAVHFIPPSVHGNVVGINATELDSAANITMLLNEGEGPVKVNEMSISASPDTISTVTPRAGRIPRAGEEEEQSSGMFGETVVPAVDEVGVAAPPQLSPDSAETEHLLPSSPRGPEVMEGEEEEDEEEERLPHTDPPWIHVKDTAVFDLDHLFTTTTAAPPSPSSNPSNPDVLHVDFFDPSSRGRGLSTLAPPSPSSLAHELQGGDPTSWAMPDNYDYLTPYEDSVSPTADEPRVPGSGSFVPGAALPGAGAPVPKIPVAAPPAASPVDGSDGMGGCRVGYQMVNGSCRSPCDALPNYCFNGGQCYLLEGMGVFCRCNVQDYIWHKGARCESVVTEFQVMCLAVGASALVVLLLFMIIVCFAKKLHVLKTENKKLRKRSSKYRPTSEQHNDNFSLSTIAEGSHPNVRKLCDTPPNVPHARALAYYDNIICQKTMSRYTWECKTKEESDCEDDPNSQNKLEDPVKAPPKEDDSLNIHNSLTPKHENHKVLGEENSSEKSPEVLSVAVLSFLLFPPHQLSWKIDNKVKVTIDLELHFSKKTKFTPSKRPFARYDVYLYRKPKAKSQNPNGPRAKTINGPSRAKGRVLRWEDDMYPPSPPCSVCSPISTRSLPASVFSGEFILVSDRQSDASFLVHHFLSLYLRARCRVWFLGLVQSFNHYSAISQRLGVSLAQAKEKGQLVFLEGLNESLSVLIPEETNTGNQAMDFLRDPAVGLKSLYEFVRSSVSSSGCSGEGAADSEEWGPPVLLVDDLSVLLSLGVSVGAVLDFSHYCRATVCSQLKGNVVMLARCDGEEEDDGDDEGAERLLKGLTHQCSLTLHVQGLPTGYCRDIHGQVEVCWRRRQGDGQYTQRKLFQYKVHDKGASFFAPGTSSAVL
ncbi:hypothetical protein L3Q82_012984 [Scortum barcoo]|uniref:Uncharacterized protein n=1 Tax=Scortum barcoo TaxID=214431 RepID=A0ACB8VZU7_9TELE|nr:hypothetical protein L3Q82_012984 [Scortum barcoo]